MIVPAFIYFFIYLSIYLFRPDSSEPFALVEPVTEIIIDFPTPVVLGTIDLVDDVNVESFEVSFIDSEGNQSPFYVSILYCMLGTRHKY